MEAAEGKRRIEILDLLRGILIIYVVLYHTLYDLAVISGVRMPFFFTDWFEILRQCLVGMLILIAGISCNLTRSNLKRGLKTLLCGMVITVATVLFLPEERIIFGILHFFGTSMMLYGALEKGFQKIPMWAGAAGALFLFLLTKNIFYGFIGIGSFGISFSLPIENLLVFILGFQADIFSSDYFPILPHFFLFLTGAFLGRDIKKRRLPRFFYCCGLKPLQTIGRHTLLIYLLHQPIVYGILCAFFWLNKL